MKSRKTFPKLNTKHIQLILYLSICIMGICFVLLPFPEPKRAQSASGDIDAVDESVHFGAHSTSLAFADSSVPANTTVTLTPTLSPTITVTPTITPTPTPANPLEKNLYPEVNNLVEEYYQASLSCNEDDLQKLVNDPALLDPEMISKKYEFVKSLKDFNCYTKQGIGSVAYVVYVSFNTEYITIATSVPTLERLPLVYREDGTLVVNLSTPTEDYKAFCDILQTHDDVIALNTEVHESYDAAVAADETLAALDAELNKSRSSK